MSSDPEAVFTVKNCKAIPWKCLFREWGGRNYKEEVIYINNIYIKYIIYNIYIIINNIYNTYIIYIYIYIYIYMHINLYI